MFSLILWMLAQSALSDVPFPLPNASLVKLHQPAALVSGLLVVNYTTHGGRGELVLNIGIKKVLADAVGMVEAAIQYGITERGRHKTFQYQITFSGDSPDTNATEQAVIASERLSKLNASSVMTLVAELWPQLREIWPEKCDNESSWQDFCSPPNPWALAWMSQPELSLWLSLATVATTESQGCEQRDGFVRVHGGSGVFSVNDIVMNSSIEEIDEWRVNVSREMRTWRNALKAAIPTCPHGLHGKQFFKGLDVYGRCWNQSEDSCGSSWGYGPWFCKGDSETWSHCQPHNCSLSCQIKFEGKIELCGQSGGEIRDALDSLSDQVQYVKIWPSVRSFEIKNCEYEHVIEVTPGSNFFGTFAHLRPLPGVSEPWGQRSLTNMDWVSGFLQQKGLAWKSVQIYNNSGLFSFIRLRAFESALGGEKESWVNFTTDISNYLYDEFPLGTGGYYYHMNHPDPLGDPHRVRLQIQWRIKVSSPRSLSTPWLAPEIHLPCLVEFQEHLLKVNFLPNGSGHHHPLRGSRFNAPLANSGGRGRVSVLWPSEEWGNFEISDSLWAQPAESEYEMTSEDLRAWQLRHNISEWWRPGDYNVLDKIAAGPAPNSLEITFVPPAGGPNTKWRICFIPADGFHIYPKVCTEQFPVRETAEGCQKMDQMDENAESSKGVQMTAAACLTSLWFAVTWF